MDFDARGPRSPDDGEDRRVPRRVGDEQEPHGLARVECGSDLGHTRELAANRPHAGRRHNRYAFDD